MTNSTEERIARICADLLGLDRVDAKDDLYELGCDSQQAVRIALAIERAFSVDLPLEMMEMSGRVNEIAIWVDKQIGIEEASMSPTCAGTPGDS